MKITIRVKKGATTSDIESALKKEIIKYTGSIPSKELAKDKHYTIGDVGHLFMRALDDPRLSHLTESLETAEKLYYTKNYIFTCDLIGYLIGQNPDLTPSLLNTIHEVLMVAKKEQLEEEAKEAAAKPNEETSTPNIIQTLSDDKHPGKTVEVISNGPREENDKVIEALKRLKTRGVISDLLKEGDDLNIQFE